MSVADPLRVTFFVPGAPSTDRLADIDPDRDWRIMTNGQRWLLQTYLRLARAGLPVEISDTPPADGLVVFFARHHRLLRRGINGHSNPVLLGIRADKNEKAVADFEVVQNGRWADGSRRFFVPYWPQPGLIPRDPARGNKVQCIAFKGFDLNLHEYFFTRQWREWLEEHGLRWSQDSMPYELSEEIGINVDWHDYRSVDVLLALRPPARRNRRYERRGHTHKPATKLYNAWHAGVPAILGPEYAFRELRRAPDDYIEVSDPVEAKAAVSRLRADSGLYRRMVDNGRRRALEFSHDRLIERWADLLYDRIPRLVTQRGANFALQMPVAVRSRVRGLCRRLTWRIQR